jgi:hypothetical protein
LSPSVDNAALIDALITRFDVAYLLIDEDRYANSQASALPRYVSERPRQLREVWKSTSGAASVIVYACENRRDHKELSQ